MDGILVAEDNVVGKKTLEGLNIPTKSRAKRPGKNFEVADNVRVAI